MGKQIKIFIFLFALLPTLWGCSRLEPASPPVSASRVVTQIRVEYENGALRTHRLYTTAEKMQKVLNYLRVIDPYGNPEEDPETVGGSNFRITLTYSDNREKVYLQRSDRFMKTDSGAWKRIDPKQAQELSRILGQTKSD